jgi:hypothetical protein
MKSTFQNPNRKPGEFENALHGGNTDRAMLIENAYRTMTEREFEPEFPKQASQQLISIHRDAKVSSGLAVIRSDRSINRSSRHWSVG